MDLQTIEEVVGKDGLVRMEYTNSQEVWVLVIEQATEQCEVITESNSVFVVEYLNVEELATGVRRFGGAIDYQFIPPPYL